MTTYSVHLDITLSGSVEIEANSIAEAEAKAKKITQPTSSFYHFSTDVVEGDTEEVIETCHYCGAKIESSHAHYDIDGALCESCYDDLEVNANMIDGEDTCSICGNQIDEGRARQLADESIVCEDCFIEATAKAKGLV